MRQDLLKGLSESQIAKVKKCKSQQELLALAKEEGIELTDEQLTAVTGGSCLPSFITIIERTGNIFSFTGIDVSSICLIKKSIQKQYNNK